MGLCLESGCIRNPSRARLCGKGADGGQWRMLRVKRKGSSKGYQMGKGRMHWSSPFMYSCNFNPCPIPMSIDIVESVCYSWDEYCEKARKPDLNAAITVRELTVELQPRLQRRCCKKGHFQGRSPQHCQGQRPWTQLMVLLRSSTLSTSVRIFNFLGYTALLPIEESIRSFKAALHI